MIGGHWDSVLCFQRWQRSMMNAETRAIMFTPQPIGFVRSPFKSTEAIPKGLGARHVAEGVLDILPAFHLASPISRVTRIS